MRRGPLVRMLPATALLAAALLATALLAGCAGGPPPLPPQSRPPPASDEAGYWLLADRLEEALRAAPHAIRDPALTAYVRRVACRVAAAHCPDLRVHVVREPGFNAAMAPNGTLVLPSGLLLRLADEAQLAAVIGHELGHFVERHTFAAEERARILGDLSAWVALIGIGPGGYELGGYEPGGYGLGETLAENVTLDTLAYGRDQERAADAFGLKRMAAAGYAPAAAAEVWDLAVAEAEAGGETLADRLLASHPAPQERRRTLVDQAAALPQAPASRGQERYRAALAPFRDAFLADEVRLRLPTATLLLFRYLAERDGLDASLAFHWGEVYRLRGWQGDRAKALAQYARGLALPGALAATHRSIGLVRRALGQRRGARFAFERYLAAAPDAPDRAVIEAYIAGTL